MSNFNVDGILVSKNAKTGLSINVDTCRPTRWCFQRCYRKFRSQALIDELGWDSTPNTGPVTWRTQTESYRRTEARIKELYDCGELPAAAKKMAQRLLKRDFDCLRGNGTGDLNESLCHLYVELGKRGVHVYLFCRIPAEIDRLRRLADRAGLAGHARPFVLGSIDPSTPKRTAAALVRATTRMNGAPALAYATDTNGEAGAAEVDAHPLREYIKVVFGYHTNQVKTKIPHSLVCQSTNGENVKCNECRRCFGEQS